MYEYLNFGYCLLGRIIEQRSGQTYETYVRNAVLAPSGVSAMAIAGNTVAERRPREVMYTPAGAYSLNVRRFDSHGGWVASPIDLMRFLVRVDGSPSKPDIITAASRTAMVTPANVNDVNGNNPNYGFGWAANPQSHNGAMAGTTAVLALRPNGFGYAAVANMRPGGDQFAAQLAKMVQDIIAGVSAWPGYDLF
jgi:CubicO group peptidase (beta-lactamase class C family)